MLQTLGISNSIFEPHAPFDHAMSRSLRERSSQATSDASALTSASCLPCIPPTAVLPRCSALMLRFKNGLRDYERQMTSKLVVIGSDVYMEFESVLPGKTGRVLVSDCVVGLVRPTRSQELEFISDKMNIEPRGYTAMECVEISFNRRDYVVIQE